MPKQKVTKVEQYIKDAVKATAEEITTKGVEISDCHFDSRATINVDNGDMTEVLLKLAKAQSVIAEAVMQVAQSKPDINHNGHALNITDISSTPMEFNEVDEDE